MTPPPRCVEVVAPARLHFGFLDLDGGLGRRFGSLGLAIEGFATRVVVTRAGRDRIEGVGESERAARILARLRTAWNLPPAHVAIEAVIPPHAGLGSGTQLGLALGVGLARLAGITAGPREVARLLERGARSGVGIGVFDQGGFILDGGRGGDEPPPVTARLPFPAGWRILLLLDEAAEGLHGGREAAAFRTLPPFPPELAAHLCRLAVMRLLPGLADADLAAAGAAVGEIQRRVGDHFAPAQGGRFTSPRVAEALAWLEDQGIAGVGQSSWGPTGFAMVADAAEAERLRHHAADRWRGLRLHAVTGRNRGAEVTVEP